MSRDSDRQVQSEDFAKFFLATKNVDKKILASAKRSLKKAAEPAALDAKKEVFAMPSGKQGPIRDAPRPRLSLRASIASCIKVGIRSKGKMAGVTIRVDGKQFEKISEAGGRTGKNLKKLPKYVDGRIKRWRHPVFGQNMDKPEKWSTQKSHPFLRKSVEKHRKDFVDAMEKSVDEALKEISKKKSL